MEVMIWWKMMESKYVRMWWNDETMWDGGKW